MKRGEKFLERASFLVGIVFRMLIPPFYFFDRLEKYSKARIKKNPKAYSPMLFLANLYKDYKKYEDSRKGFLEIKRLGYLDEDDILVLAEVLCRLQDYHAVIDILSPIIDKYPQKINANWCLGISYMKRNDFQKAVFYLQKIIDAGIKRFEDYWHLGYCYSQIGKLEEAKDAYSQALYLKPDSHELKQNIASIYLRKGYTFLDSDLAMAEKEFEKARGINPDDRKIMGILESVRKIEEKDSIIKLLKEQLETEHPESEKIEPPDKKLGG